MTNKKEEVKVIKVPGLMIAGSQVPLILFSGGMDSTHLLSERLEVSDVDILYVKGQQGPAKIENELAAREKIKKWMAKNKPFKIRNEYVYNDDKNHPPANHRFGQVLSWFNGALSVSCDSLHSVVEMAYVSGDSVCSDLHWITQGWNNLGYVVKQRLVPLAFPLAYTPKNYILQNISPDLLKLVWVCELPVKKRVHYKPCGKCKPCITHEVENFRLKLDRERTPVLGKA